MQLLPVTERPRGLGQELAPALEEQTEKPPALAQVRALLPLKVKGMLKAQALAPELALVAPEVRLQGLALAQAQPQVRAADQPKDLELAPEQEQEVLVEWPLAQALAQVQLLLKAAALLRVQVQELAQVPEAQVDMRLVLAAVLVLLHLKEVVPPKAQALALAPGQAVQEDTRLALVQARDLLLLKVTGMLKAQVPALEQAQAALEVRQLALVAVQARHHHMAVARLKDRALELERELAELVDTRLAQAAVLDLLQLKEVVPPKGQALARAPGQEELEVTLLALEVAQVQHNLKVAAQRKDRVLVQVLELVETEAQWRLALAQGLLPLKAMAQAPAQEPAQALAPVAPEA